jgi:hypothetical protein
MLSSRPLASKSLPTFLTNPFLIQNILCGTKVCQHGQLPISPADGQPQTFSNIELRLKPTYRRSLLSAGLPRHWQDYYHSLSGSRLEASLQAGRGRLPPSTFKFVNLRIDSGGWLVGRFYIKNKGDRRKINASRRSPAFDVASDLRRYDACPRGHVKR